MPHCRCDNSRECALMRFFVCCALVACALSVSPMVGSVARAGGSTPEPHHVAMRTFGVWEAETQERFDFSVWYPSRNAASESSQDGWIVEAARRDRVLSGFFPVLLLSHDTAGSRFANNDMAASLAAGGAIVIVPTHAGDNQHSSSMIYSAELLRDRPRQLLRALETVLASPDFAPHADESRIGLLGVGFGCITVLQLAGAAPDFSLLEQHCNAVNAVDGFCAPWARDRLLALPDAMRAMRMRQGEDVFSPSLALLAPELVPVPVTAQDRRRYESVGFKPERKAGLWRRLFGGSAEGDQREDGKQAPEAAGGDAPAEAAPPAEGAARQAEPAQAAAPESADGAEGGQADAASGEEAPASGLAPEPTAAAGKDGKVFRRLPAVRAIRGIALVGPAGGMLFPREALAGVLVPVAMVEAELDELYPPGEHAQPYVSGLPAQPLVLRIQGADHFSLFARCATDSLETLGEICGRLQGEVRRKKANERDRFLVSFFQSILGGGLPAPEPSGLVAVEKAQ